MKRFKGFTMLEILIISIVVGTGLLSILFSIQKVKQKNNQLIQQTIANQLAQEGIEMIYQIRNTNLLKFKNHKEYCRLNKDHTQECSDYVHPNWLKESNYILSGTKLIKTNNNLDLSDGISTGENIFNMCLSGNTRYSCSGNNNTKYGRFLRSIEGKGLYLKDNTTGGTKISCSSGSGTNCHDNKAKEFRFCSKVIYIGQKSDIVELCGIITNFSD